ncbi:hypothetical protein B0H12DRAFT_1070740 [Mycena haematopus]|nr:hypothetical protein B0H12DRAFT_1070740 [Mycena haematopus]
MILSPTRPHLIELSRKREPEYQILDRDHGSLDGIKDLALLPGSWLQFGELNSTILESCLDHGRPCNSSRSRIDVPRLQQIPPTTADDEQCAESRTHAAQETWCGKYCTCDPRGPVQTVPVLQTARVIAARIPPSVPVEVHSSGIHLGSRRSLPFDPMSCDLKPGEPVLHIGAIRARGSRRRAEGRGF